MKRLTGFLLFLLALSNVLSAQVGINTDGSQPNSSAMLDVKSNFKGFLPPRMTQVERDNIQNPAEGLIVICTDCALNNSTALSIYINGMWRLLTGYCVTPLTPAPGKDTATATQITWNWNAVSNATGYRWGTTNIPSAAIDVGNVLSHTETGLTCNSSYTRYIWAYNECGQSPALSTSKSTAMDPPPGPTAGNHFSSPTEIGWSWNPVAGAAGYMWDTTNNLTTARDLGTATTRTETGLTCNTAYTRYIWAYGPCGISSSTAINATTLVDPPSAPIAGMHVPSETQIVWNWNTVDGATGYKWNTSEDYSTAIDLGSDTSKTETGVTCGTSYNRYVWVYNNCGNSIPSILSQAASKCPCGQPLIDERDSKAYNTVQIGTQCWLKKNLNTGTLINGTQEPANNGTIEKYCYGDLETNCDVYGGLYNWNEAMQYLITEGAKGICPAGSHIPSNTEWTVLTDYLGGASVAGGKMKEAGTSHWAAPNTGATDSSSFTALPGGTLNGENTYVELTNSAYYWSSSRQDDSHQWYRKLDHNFQEIFGQISLPNVGFSIRCLLDTCISNTTAHAGPFQLNVPGTTTTLAANSPGPGETGTWTIAVGTGGSLTNLHNPATTFTGVAGETYLLFWIISNACHTSTDSVMISFAAPTWPACPGIPSIDYGGQTYHTVQIGTQCWTKENLNIGTMINGNQDATNNGIIEKYCYDNNPTNCADYGGLYQWNEMMQYTTTPQAQGICPQGWHLPSDIDWSMLTNFLGGAGIAGGKMKETGFAHWQSPNVGATNSSDFTALAGGNRSPDGYFYNLTQYAYIWSSSQHYNNVGFAWCRSLYFNIQDVWKQSPYMADGFSVRCLKDDCLSNTTSNAGPDQLNVQGSAVTLAANPPGPGETGFWTIVSGSGGNLVDPNDPATTFNGFTGETYQLTWTITNFCHTSTDEVTISFSNVFVCGTSTVFYEGQTYNSVQIGTQCWMKENLNVGVRVDVTTIPWNNGVIEKYCFNNDPANCAIYGAYYQWDEMMQYTTTPGAQGICPQGWHIPGNDEWTVLNTFLGGTSIAGGKMKEAGYAHWLAPNTGATNSSGFTALPGGCRNAVPSFSGLEISAYFWSSSQIINATTYAWCRNLVYNYETEDPGDKLKTYGMSVRCLKN